MTLNIISLFNGVAMSELIEWARANCTISVDNDSVIIGRYYNKAFRILINEGRVAIAKVDEDTNKVESWLSPIWVKDLQSFKTYLNCN